MPQSTATQLFKQEVKAALHKPAAEGTPDPDRVRGYSLSSEVSSARQSEAARLDEEVETPRGDEESEEEEEGEEAPAAAPAVRTGWPAVVRGELLKHCGIHGWQPRYLRVRTTAKLFLYTRSKDSSDYRAVVGLDSTVRVVEEDPIGPRRFGNSKEPVVGYPFAIVSPRGKMRFLAMSPSMRSEWVGCLRWSIQLEGEPGVVSTPSVARASPRKTAASVASTPTKGMSGTPSVTLPSRATDGTPSGRSVLSLSTPPTPSRSVRAPDPIPEEVTPKGPGPVPSEGIPSWLRAAAEMHQAAFLKLAWKDPVAENWNPTGGSNGVTTYLAKGALPGARGDGVVPWPTKMILGFLRDVTHLCQVDDQLERQEEIQTFGDNQHYSIARKSYKAPSALVGPREFLTLTYWQVYGENEAAGWGLPPETLAISASSRNLRGTSEAQVPVQSGFTRGDVPIGGWLFRPRAPSGPESCVCDGTYVSIVNPKGSLPHFVVKMVLSKQGMLVDSLAKALERHYKAPSWMALKGERVPIDPPLRNLGYDAMVRAARETASPVVQTDTAAPTEPAIVVPERPKSPLAANEKYDSCPGIDFPFEPDESKLHAHSFSPLSLMALLVPLLALVFAWFAFEPTPSSLLPWFLPEVLNGVIAPSFDAQAMSSSAPLGTGLAATLADVPVVGALVRPVDASLAASLLVVAALIAALRAIYRAWVGPSWMSSRQKLSIASWDPPMEGNIHGAVTLDCTPVLKWIDRVRDATGDKVTLTHVVIKAVGLALRACPQLNGRVVLGEFVPAGSVDVGCLVALERSEGETRTPDLAFAKVCDADRASVAAIASTIAAKADRLRSLKDKDFEATKDAVKLLPTWLLRPVTHWMGWLASGLGVTIPCLGVRALPMGSCMVTAVGGLGLDVAYAPFTPFLHVPLLVAIGSMRDAVIAVDGAPAVRKVVTVTATVDHRCIDGGGAAMLPRVLRAVFEAPEKMLGGPRVQ
jgi:hypothetical protein